jgi:hypothetical protein
MPELSQLLGVKRTSRRLQSTSLFDPTETSAGRLTRQYLGDYRVLV